VGSKYWFSAPIKAYVTNTNNIDLVASVVMSKTAVALLFTFSLNFICAALISWRIYRDTSPLPAYGGSGIQLSRIPEIVLQSAGVNCAVLIAIIISSFVRTNFMIIILNFYPSLSAIVFSLLILRVCANPVTPTVPTLQSIIRFVPIDTGAYPEFSVSAPIQTSQISGERFTSGISEDGPREISCEIV